MDKVGSAEGEGATMGRTKDASGDRYKRRISGMQNSARDGADRPKDRKTNGSRDVKSMDHLLPSSSYSRQHERENGLRPVDSLRSRGVCPPPPLPGCPVRTPQRNPVGQMTVGENGTEAVM